MAEAKPCSGASNSGVKKDALLRTTDLCGWTLQERYLAGCRLSFGDAGTGVRQSCTTMPAYKSPRFTCDAWGERPSPAAVAAENTTQKPPNRREIVQWRSTVLGYAGRQLSVAEDRLFAIAGIITRGRNQYVPPDDVYLAGLWKSDLTYGLLWRFGFPAGHELPLSRYRSPGWSWISVFDHAGYPKPQLIDAISSDVARNLRPAAALVAHHVQLASPLNPFGHVTHGRLTLRAKRAARSSAFRGAERPRIVEEYCAYRLTAVQDASVQLVLVAEGQDYRPSRRFAVGLLVHPLPPIGASPASWQRLGMFRMWENSDNGMVLDWSAVPETEVTLV